MHTSQDDPDNALADTGTSEYACADFDISVCLDNKTHPSSIHLWVDMCEEEDPLDLGVHLG